MVVGTASNTYTLPGLSTAASSAAQSGPVEIVTTDAARLAGIFAGLRARDIGLRRVVLASPVYAEPPKVLDNGMYRVKGSFRFRPVGIDFELLFQHTDGGWQLFGVSIAPAEMPAPPADGPADGNASESGG